MYQALEDSSLTTPTPNTPPHVTMHSPSFAFSTSRTGCHLLKAAPTQICDSRRVLAIQLTIQPLYSTALTPWLRGIQIHIAKQRPVPQVRRHRGKQHRVVVQNIVLRVTKKTCGLSLCSTSRGAWRGAPLMSQCRHISCHDLVICACALEAAKCRFCHANCQAFLQEGGAYRRLEVTMDHWRLDVNNSRLTVFQAVTKNNSTKPGSQKLGLRPEDPFLLHIKSCTHRLPHAPQQHAPLLARYQFDQNPPHHREQRPLQDVHEHPGLQPPEKPFGPFLLVDAQHHLPVRGGLAAGLHLRLHDPQTVGGDIGGDGGHHTDEGVPDRLLAERRPRRQDGVQEIESIVPRVMPNKAGDELSSGPGKQH
mmetsp:Transcript_3546/g.6785  ORF Transcript_3546/g.6785 Transcript_3546/m.6785 type:complete len:364 (+) Transcript_3546:963-2054(+)